MKLPKSYNNPISQKNRIMGKRNEEMIEERLNNKWFNFSFPIEPIGRNIKWRVIDFISEKHKVCIELKSRNLYHNQYDTIMIGHNKYIKSLELIKQGYKAFFFFYYEKDKKLMFFDIPKILPNDIEIRRGGTTKRGCKEYDECMYIPIKYLEDIEKYDTYNMYKETH